MGGRERSEPSGSHFGGGTPSPPDTTSARGRDLAPGTSVTVGMRPEALAPATDGSAGIRVTVEHVEQLGHETLTHVRVLGADEMHLVARLPARLTGQRGEELRLAPDPDRLYLFAADGTAL